MRWLDPSRLAALLAPALLLIPTGAAVADGVATYRVRMIPGSSRLIVSATLPVAGDALSMDTTRPAGIPELDSLGWAGLVRNLRVADAANNTVRVARDGTRGWKLERPDTTTLSLEYEVDYAPLERRQWPAPREAAYRDSNTFALVGRSLFVTTEATGECRAAFELPAGWYAATPWRPEQGANTFVTAGPQELLQNLVVLSRQPRLEVVASGFRLHVFAFGHWAAARGQVERVLRAVVQRHVTMMAHTGRADYVVVLLPLLESGAESYRGSFALSTDKPPDQSTHPAWANLVAHEIFHVWNGWLLRGADYASTQWFQEGFTEYAANAAIVTSGLAGEDWLRAKLAEHVRNSRRLATTLENTGGRKGPPLYSAGALVAFTWDVRIRAASGGRSDLGAFFRELMRRTDGGKGAYAWPDLRAALDATAVGDWEAFYQAYIRGSERLPIQQALASVGQRLVESAEGQVRIEANPGAPPDAQRLWTDLLRGK